MTKVMHSIVGVALVAAASLSHAADAPAPQFQPIAGGKPGTTTTGQKSASALVATPAPHVHALQATLGGDGQVHVECAEEANPKAKAKSTYGR